MSIEDLFAAVAEDLVCGDAPVKRRRLHAPGVWTGSDRFFAFATRSDLMREWVRLSPEMQAFVRDTSRRLAPSL